MTPIGISAMFFPALGSERWPLAHFATPIHSREISSLDSNSIALGVSPSVHTIFSCDLDRHSLDRT